MLLKEKSKPSRKNFKRKKLDVLGSFKEIKDGSIKVDTSLKGFSINPNIMQQK